MAYYTSKINEICDTLGSIIVTVDDDKMVQICLEGLAQMFGSFRTTVLLRERPPTFFVLESMILVVENHAGTLKSTHNDD